MGKVRQIFQDKLITDSNITRMLGINLQNNLSWEAHLATGKRAILPGVRRLIGMMQKIRRHLSFRARKHLVESLVISKFTYLICLWGNTTSNKISKAQVCLNIAVRYVTGDKKSVSLKQLMEHCDWLNVRELTEYHSLMMIWKAVRWGRPSYLKEKLTLDENDILLMEEPPKNNRLDKTFTVKKVKSAFAHMGSYKSAGPDGFKPIIMKHFGPKALMCINNIFQAIYSTGYIPIEFSKIKSGFYSKAFK